MLKAGRTLLPDFQARVIFGIATFVGILLLVGWVAINEPGRMLVFTSQYQGRSIENGAQLFANNCATCHGTDARGLAGRAPGINNPMLFLKNNPAKVANTNLQALQTQQTTLQGQITTYNADLKKIEDAQNTLKTAAAGSDQAKAAQQAIDTANAEIKTIDVPGNQKQLDALKPQVDQATADLKKLTDQGWDPNRDSRLTEVKWAGSLADYITATVTGGRPASSALWPQGTMPAWGQVAGGPLRTDEIGDVVQYVLNFNDTAIRLTPKDINQQFKLGTDAGAPVSTGPKVGSSADTKQLAAAGLGGGDAAAGENLYKNVLGCATCHLQGAVGPITAGTYTRIVNTRLKDNPGHWASPEEYIAESIIHPNAYVVPSYSAGIMPQTFGDQITLTDLKNLIAYLETQK